MKRLKLRNIFLAIGAIPLLALFLNKSRTIYFQEHQRYIENLNQLRQEYALLDRDILQGRYEFLISYDSISKHLEKSKKNQKQLENIPIFINQKR